MRRLLVLLVVLVVAVLVLPPWLAEPLGWTPPAAARPEHGRGVRLADGRMLHFVERGSGTPVVLVHGLPSNAADWEPTVEALAAAGPYRVIAYDRVGYGYSTRQPAAENPWTYDSNARELGELLDALGLESAVLVGWSYGGGVVQTFAVRAPERVSHLVLVASVGPLAMDEEEDATIRLLRSPLGGPAFAWIQSVPPVARGLLRQALIPVFAREAAIPPGWVDRTWAALSLPGTVDAWREEMSHADASGLEPEAITVPTLVIHGADDYSVPFPVGEDLHRRIPDSRFLPVLDGSHMLPVTHGPLVAEAIDDAVRAY